MIIAHSFWSLAASGAASSLFQTKIWPSCLGRCAFHSHKEIARWFMISYNDGHAIPAQWVQARYLWLSHEWFCSHLIHFHFTHLVSKSPVNSPYPPFINVPWLFCFFLQLKNHDGVALQWHVRCATEFKKCYIIWRSPTTCVLALCHPDTIKVIQSSNAPKSYTYRFSKPFFGKWDGSQMFLVWRVTICCNNKLGMDQYIEAEESFVNYQKRKHTYRTLPSINEDFLKNILRYLNHIQDKFNSETHIVKN